MSTNWYVDVEVSTKQTLHADNAFDVLEALVPHAGQISLHPEGNRVGISLTVEADSATSAVTTASKIVSDTLPSASIIQLDVMTEQVRSDRNNSPTIPELVGFAEIADMAGVSRQRARTIAQREDFPVAVVETAAGPLRVKAAVEKWLSSWSRKPGRPAALQL
ncbi:hypothetical protein [Curtobacterium sp. MCSS17_016]|uniref:hypothetical protein n=1 Tax=Curtobacterium sp. MCSS17_016 TaxID=2175644 RepID=UPI000DA85237|nr:hypothetical protein [Curtobacterium sp. MCSS17_016]WIE77508.1 hypothetical protein DEJ19_010245 [Curtobacterium sp. MCSS17_016]